jgi:hypothetical protein
MENILFRCTNSNEIKRQSRFFCNRGIDRNHDMAADADMLLFPFENLSYTSVRLRLGVLCYTIYCQSNLLYKIKE